MYVVFRQWRNEDFRDRQAKQTIPRFISNTEHNEKQVRNTKSRLQGADLPGRKYLIPFPNWQMGVTNIRHFIRTKNTLLDRKKMKTIQKRMTTWPMKELNMKKIGEDNELKEDTEEEENEEEEDDHDEDTEE